MFDPAAYLNPTLILQMAGVLVILLILLALARKVIKIFGLGRNHFNHRLFLIRLPKEKPKDDNRETKEKRFLRQSAVCAFKKVL